MRKKPILFIVLILILTILCAGCSNLFSFVFSSEKSPGDNKDESTLASDYESSSEILPSDAESSDDNTSSAGSEIIGETDFPDSPYAFIPCNEDVYTTDNLNIRTAPSTDADIVILLAPDKHLKRTGYHEEWSRLEYAGRTVYASSEYLTTVVPALSNESIYYGYDRVNRLKNNVPGFISWYSRNWGSYADFLQDTESNLIYLTMDEGYENSFTPKILDVLKEKEVSAVFFLTKNYVDSHPELVQRMIDEGHILGNHTCAHPKAGMPSLTPEEQRDDIMTLHNLVLDNFGYEMKLFRYPAGIFSEQSLDIVYSLGYRSVFWSFAYRDFVVDEQPDPASSLKQCIDELHPGAIYLLHAVSETNAKILGDWIDAVRAKGYEFGVYPVN